MPTQTRPPLSRRVQVYVFVIFIVGSAVLASSLRDLLAQPFAFHKTWLPLAGLTLISGWLSIKLPSTRASISISETFNFAGTILFGPSVGAALVALDAAVICLQDSLIRRRLRWQQVAFNLAAPALSIWTAAHVAGIARPLPGTTVSLDVHFLVVLGSFTALYFLLNSWLVSIAVALEQGTSPLTIWWTNFREVSVNFAAGASIAAFVAVKASGVDLTFIGVILPLLLVIYFTYRWSTKRVEAERDKVQELNRVFLSTVEALALAIDAKDQVTHGHIRRVQRHTMALAEAVGVRDEKLLDAIRAAALLHDTGKLAVPEYILNKPGPLTSAEFERMKVHADVGADILRSIDFPYPVEPIVRHHHEQWDGSGYPSGLKAQDIPLGARILSVVDCYDALTSDRPYRPRMSRSQAEQVLVERRGKAFDPWIVDTFLAILDKQEDLDRAEHQRNTNSAQPKQVPVQLDVISATTAEERELNELRRDLPRAASLATATEALFRHINRLVPIETMAMCLPKPGTNVLIVSSCLGVGASSINGREVAIGERISGWAFAHSQAVANSDATLELGPVARAFQVPLRYAAAIPVVDGRVKAVLMVYSTQPLERDHERILENAATLFVSAFNWPGASGTAGTQTPPDPDHQRIH